MQRSRRCWPWRSATATGEGRFVEVTMAEAALNVAAEAVIEYSATGQLLTRDGNRGLDHAPQGVYRALGDDAWVALAVTDDDQWATLCSVLGDASLASDAALATVEGRRAAHDRIDEAIAAWSSELERDDADRSAPVGRHPGRGRDPRPRHHPQPAAAPPRPVRAAAAPGDRADRGADDAVPPVGRGALAAARRAHAGPAQRRDPPRDRCRRRRARRSWRPTASSARGRAAAEDRGEAWHIRIATSRSPPRSTPGRQRSWRATTRSASRPRRRSGCSPRPGSRPGRWTACSASSPAS